MPAPPVQAAFDMDLMTYEEERWYSPLSPGWPTILALGVFLKVPWLVNPVLAGINVLLTYLLVGEIFSRRTSRLAVLLLCVITYLMAFFVAKEILKTLLAGLTLNAAYAVITVMTLFYPGLCRRGSAIWTLSATMVSLLVWFVLPGEWCATLHHPIYLVLPVSIVSFFAVTLFDKRLIT